MAIMYKTKKMIIDSSLCDEKGFIKPSEIWNSLQDMAADHATDLGVGYDVMYPQGLAWVILYQQYIAEKELPKCGEEIIINTWPKIGNKLELEREYEIKNSNNELIIKAVSNWTVIDLNTRRIARADRIKFNGEYYDYYNFKGKQKRKLGLKFDNFLQEYQYIIKESDIDVNKHLNNAKYLDIIANMNIIKNDKLKRVEISFIHEAYLNDTINIGYNIDDEGHACFIGKCNDNLCFEARYEMEE